MGGDGEDEVGVVGGGASGDGWGGEGCVGGSGRVGAGFGRRGDG